MLEQCTALAHLNLSGNRIGNVGAERHEGVLAQCTALAHLNFRRNQIGEAGTERLAGVLGQFQALVHNNLNANDIGSLSGKGGFELRGVVKPVTFFCRHLALLALCHLFSRQTTRKSDILYT